MRRSNNWAILLLAAGGLCLTGCGDTGAVDSDVEMAQAFDLRGAVWMGADPVQDSFLVLSHREIDGQRLSNVAILNSDGSPRKSWDLTKLALSFNFPMGAPHWFPGQRQLVIVSQVDRAAFGLNVDTGDLRQLSSALTSSAADEAGGRLFVGEGTSLRVIDVASATTLTSPTFLQTIPSDLTIGTGGSLNFVLAGVGGAADWFHLAPPSFQVVSRPLRSDREMRIDAVDDERRRAFVQHSNPYEAYLEAVSLDDQTSRQQAPRLASELFFPHISGIWKGAPFIWIQNDLGAMPPGVEPDRRMWLYDAATLRPIRMVPVALDDSRDEMQRGPSGQVVVLRGALEFEKWDLQSFQVSASTSLFNAAGPWAVDWARGIAAFITFTDMDAAHSAKLVRIQLDTMRIL